MRQESTAVDIVDRVGRSTQIYCKVDDVIGLMPVSSRFPSATVAHADRRDTKGEVAAFGAS